MTLIMLQNHPNFKGKKLERHKLKKSKKKDPNNLTIGAPSDGQRASPAFSRGTGKGVQKGRRAPKKQRESKKEKRQKHAKKRGAKTKKLTN